MIKLRYKIDGEKREIVLEDGVQILGRNSACDITIKHQSISGQHVRIDVKGDSLTFRDLISRNGTYLNGTKTENGSLSPGDRFRLGKLEMLVESDMPAESGTAAAAPPPAFVPPEPSPDETPADMSFAPVPVNGEGQPPARAVEVVKPSDNLPVHVGRPGAPAVLKKKKVIYAAAAVIAVLLFILLLIPATPPPPPPPPPPKLTYWDVVEKGLQAFNDRKYEVALKQWAKADKELKEPGSRNRVAEVFVKFGRPFAYAKKKDYSTTDWNEIVRELLDLLQEGDIAQNEKAENFAQRAQNIGVSESKNQVLYESIQSAMAEKKFEDIRPIVATIPPESIYHEAASSYLKKADDGVYLELHSKMTSAAGDGKFAEAIEIGEELQKIKQTADVEERLASFRKIIRMDELVKRFRSRAKSQRYDDWRDAVDAIFPQIPAERVNAHGLQAILDNCKEKIFLSDLSRLYREWVTARILELEKKPPLESAKARVVFAKVHKLLDLQKKAIAAKKKKDYELQNKYIDEIREIESSRDHPLNRWARSEVVPPAVRAQELLEAARKKFAVANYRDARKHVADAQKLNAGEPEAISALLGQLKKLGIKLYNQGVNKLNGERFAAKGLMLKAYDCFSPEGDAEELKWRGRIADRIQKEFGTDPPDFNEIEKKHQNK